jgi:hypothetical protein
VNDRPLSTNKLSLSSFLYCIIFSFFLGVALFVTIAGLACFVWSIWSCFCRRKDGTGTKKYGAVELSSSVQQNGGFSDHDDGENGFSDEDIAIDDSIRRRGA